MYQLQAIVLISQVVHAVVSKFVAFKFEFQTFSQNSAAPQISHPIATCLVLLPLVLACLHNVIIYSYISINKFCVCLKH